VIADGFPTYSDLSNYDIEKIANNQIEIWNELKENKKEIEFWYYGPDKEEEEYNRRPVKLICKQKNVILKEGKFQKIEDYEVK